MTDKKDAGARVKAMLDATLDLDAAPAVDMAHRYPQVPCGCSEGCSGRAIPLHGIIAKSQQRRNPDNYHSTASALSRASTKILACSF